MITHFLQFYNLLGGVDIMAFMKDELGRTVIVNDGWRDGDIAATNNDRPPVENLEKKLEKKLERETIYLARCNKIDKQREESYEEANPSVDIFIDGIRYFGYVVEAGQGYEMLDFIVASESKKKQMIESIGSNIEFPVKVISSYLKEGKVRGPYFFVIHVDDNEVIDSELYTSKCTLTPEEAGSIFELNNRIFLAECVSITKEHSNYSWGEKWDDHIPIMVGYNAGGDKVCGKLRVTSREKYDDGRTFADNILSQKENLNIEIGDRVIVREKRKSPGEKFYMFEKVFNFMRMDEAMSSYGPNLITLANGYETGDLISSMPVITKQFKKGYGLGVIGYVKNPSLDWGKGFFYNNVFVPVENDMQADALLEKKFIECLEIMEPAPNWNVIRAKKVI